ncbi:RNA polymerase sigma factor [Planctomycetota bacterium]
MGVDWPPKKVLRGNMPTDEIVIRFKSCYQQFKTDTARVIQYYLHDRFAVDDVLQETFMELYRCLCRNEDTIKNPKAYIMKIARNLAMDYLSRRSRKREISLDDAGRLAFTAAPGVATEQVQVLLPILSQLSGAQREVIMLKVFQDLSFREIAGITGLNASTVQSHYRRGMEHIRNRLGA